MDAQRENLIKEQLELATREIISQLKGTQQILKHARSHAIESEIDFLLGSVIGRILERSTYRLINRKVSLTREEFLWVNQFLFSKVNEFKNYIQRMLYIQK